MNLTDQVIAITGSLRPMTRQAATDFLTSQGAVVQAYVSSATTVLVLGHKQIDLFQPDKRSRKYQAALDRIAAGQKIRILSEEEFFQLVKQSQI